MLHRQTVWVSALLLACAVGLPSAAAHAEERYSFVAANAPEDGLRQGDRLQITLNRWSSDEERDALLNAAKDEGGQESLLRALPNVTGPGHIQWPGGLEYNIRYARQTTRADGRTEVVLLTDRPLWVWWDDSIDAPIDRPLSAISLTLDGSGKGEGRLSLGGELTADPTLGITFPAGSGRALIADLRKEG